MSIHPQVQAILDTLAELGLPAVQDLSPAAAREQFASLVRARDVVPTPVGGFERRRVPGADGEVAVNVYRPEGEERPPLLVYFHGGGHVFGNPDTHDNTTRNLCVGAGCTVVSVDYRKAPEHKFPAAAEDAYAVTRWCAEHADALGVDPTRIAVAGDSAGGNLAAVTAIAARDRDGPALRFQLLVYPIGDYACHSDSYTRYATGYGSLEAATMRWFQNHYLRDPSDADDWRASPIKAASLADLPPALLITAQYDVLHDDGADYVAALAAAGNQARHLDYDGMIHGFFGMTPMVDAAVEAQAAAAAALRQAFAR